MMTFRDDKQKALVCNRLMDLGGISGDWFLFRHQLPVFFDETSSKQVVFLVCRISLDFWNATGHCPLSMLLTHGTPDFIRAVGALLRAVSMGTPLMVDEWLESYKPPTHQSSTDMLGSSS